MGRNYLIAVDSSPKSQFAFQEALELFTKNDHVDVLTISEQIHHANFGGIQLQNFGAPKLGEHVIGMNKNIEGLSSQLLTGLSDKLKGKGISHATHLGHGDVKEVILAKAVELNADFLILGARELLKPESGVIIDYVSKNSPCSVILMKERHKAPEADLRHSSLVDKIELEAE